MTKQLQKLIALVLVCCAYLGSGSNVWGQILSENFEYPVPSLLTANGWSAHSSGGTNSISVVEPGLIYEKSPVSNKGGAASLIGSGEDVHRAFTAIQSGEVYVSFLVKVSSASSAGDYFLNLGPNPMGSTLTGRVFVKSTGNGVSFGVSKVTNPAVVYNDNQVFALNETHLIVLKYSFKTVSATDDVVELFVNPKLGEAAPAALAVSTIGGNDAQNIASVGLRQGATSTAPSLLVDGIQVGQSWESVTSIAAHSAVPSMTANVSALDFGDKLINSTLTDSYLLSAVNVAAGSDIVLTTQAPFSLSKSETENFSTSLSFTSAELANDTRVFVRVTPTTVGEVLASIIHKTNGASDVTVNLKVTGSSPYTQNFNNCSTQLPGGWMQVSVVGDAQTWVCSSFGKDLTRGVEMNGYKGANNENKDWLISPSLNLSAFNLPVLSFWSKTKFSGNFLRLMVSTNYSGTGNPNAVGVTWTEVNGLFPALDTDVWKESKIDLSDFKNQNVHIAFIYTSTEFAAARWTLDDFSVTDETTAPAKPDATIYTNINNQTFDFNHAVSGTTSDAKTFELLAYGLSEPLVLTASSEFLLSKDGVSKSNAITYSPAELNSTKLVYIYFAPTKEQDSINGKVTIANGSNVIEPLTLIGSSRNKATTFDVVTWNLEWFGADKDGSGVELGPENEDLQYQNVKKGVKILDADVFAFQEVVSEDAIKNLIAEMPGYDYVKSDIYSYSWSQTAGSLPPQKLFVLYNTATVKVKSQKVLLNKLYEDVRNNTVILENYPGPTNETSDKKDDAFWASGRLPYMVELETTINGITKTIHLINVHARANSGTNMEKYNQRKYDIQVLYDSLNAQYPNINMVLLGDYNDDVDMSVVGTGNPSTYKPFVDDTNYNVLTYELSQTGVGTYQGTSFLDHITISSELNVDYSNSIKIENGVIGEIANFYKTTTDHAPVSARFNLSATPVVTFTEAAATKSEGSVKFNVNLTLSAAQATEQTVTVSAMPGGSASAADYTLTGATNGIITVTVPANTTTASFEVEVTDDNLVEADEQVTFQITDKSANLAIGAANTFLLTITDNDKSTISFATATATVNENVGEVTVNLTLAQATVAEQTVKIELGQSAGLVYTSDFTSTPAPVNGIINLTIPAGATAASFKVNIVDDATVELDEVLSLYLKETSNGLLIGSQAGYALTIQDNDKSVVFFSASSRKVSEESGTTEVTINLSQATVAQEQITVAVTNGTGVTYGVAGDYTTNPAVANGNIVLTIPAGASSVKFDITVIDDTATEEDELISFGIASVSNRLAVGTANVVFNFTIERNDVVTGIADATKGQFKVYPNPATNYVNLTLPERVTNLNNINLSVWALDGRKVYETTGNLESAKQNLSNKVGNLANGVYIIKVQAGKEVYQTRLLKK